MTVAYNSDCMEAMAQMEDNAFDLAIVDPPYGINIAKHGTLKANSKFKRGFTKDVDYGVRSWDEFIPPKQYFLELLRVSKNQIIWGGNFFLDYLGNCKEYVTWYKKGYDTNHRFSPTEWAWTSFLGVPKYYDIPWIGFGYINSGETKIHPTQKPITLYKLLLNDYAKPGDTILDTHLGSGSSRIAAHDMGFDLVGYEIDKDYFDAQEKRFQNHIKQQSLFKPNEMYQ